MGMVAMIVAAAAIGTVRVAVRVFLNIQHIARRRLVVVLMIVVRMSAMVVAAAAVIAMYVTVTGVFVVSMVMVCVIVMTMRLGRLIGAALGLECGVDHLDGGAKTARHLLQHRIAGDTDAVGEQFGGDMAVAEMPGEAGEMVRVAGDDLRDRLLGSDNRNGAPVVEREAVAILQAGGLLEVEQEHHVALAAHGDAAAVAAVMRQHHAVGGARDVPGAGGQKRAGVDHGGNSYSDTR